MAAIPQLGCAYPRCPSPAVSRLKKLAGKVSECTSCGRLMVACLTKSCQDLGTYNRPFVEYCRRCGHKVNQAPLWEEARQDGWTRKLPSEADSEGEVIEDLSPLVDTNAPGKYWATLAMIRGVVAIHQAGHFLALIKAVPENQGGALLWNQQRPFPLPADGSEPISYPPVLLPDERHLLYSDTQGMAVLDLWSCHGLSARDNEPRLRTLKCARRSIVAPPIPLGEGKIGVLTRGRSRTEELPFRWTVWDLGSRKERDEELSALLDSEGETPLPLWGKSCLSEEVDGRVVTFATPRGHWVWRVADAARSNLESLKATWPNPSFGTAPGTRTEGSKVLDIGEGYRTSTALPRQAFLVQRSGVEQFSWFFCVRQDDPTSPESIERYNVEFESLDHTLAQPIGLPTGASPIGASPDPDGIPKMFFRAGTDIRFHDDATPARYFHHGLPQAIVNLSSSGPLVVSVGQEGRDGRSIGIHSLHHKGSQCNVPIKSGNRLVCVKPLVWFHWIFTVELDPEYRLLLNRRTLTFEGS